MEENILKNLVRIGTVSTIDNTGKKARVIFQDKDMTSGWLFVLQHPGAVNIEENGEHTHSLSGGGSTDQNGDHGHDAAAAPWMPAVNDTVLVLYIPIFNGDGFILGVI
jgi:hypothetical protein